jgi:hypothetical protein
MRFINTDYVTDVRYDIPKFLDNTEDVLDVFDSYLFEKIGGYFKEQIDIKNLAVDGVFEVTTQEYRPDLISAEIYDGDTQYWWLLMEYNGIIDIFKIVSGLQMNYFSLTKLEDIYFSLNSRQRQQDR